MYHFDFVVIQNYLVKSMMTGLEWFFLGKRGAEAACTRTKNPGRAGVSLIRRLPCPRTSSASPEVG